MFHQKLDARATLLFCFFKLNGCLRRGCLISLALRIKSTQGKTVEELPKALTDLKVSEG